MCIHKIGLYSFIHEFMAKISMLCCFAEFYSITHDVKAVQSFGKS